MKFFVDARLPPSRCKVLAQHGHNALHTLDLPTKNATKDHVINQRSSDEERIVVSKDSDFFYSHLVSGRPWKLGLVRTGNISTKDLCELFERNVTELETALAQYSLIELDRVSVKPLI
jgi:predicted nuclease of predicted toxin-antitoxin system